MKTLRTELVKVFGADIRKNEANIIEFDGYVSIVKFIIAKLKELSYELSICNGTDFSIYSIRSYKNFIAVGDKKINLKKLRTTELRVLDLGAIVDMIDDSLSIFDKDEFCKRAVGDKKSSNITNYINSISYTALNYKDIENFDAGIYNYILREWMQEFRARESNLSSFFTIA